MYNDDLKKENHKSDGKYSSGIDTQSTGYSSISRDRLEEIKKSESMVGNLPSRENMIIPRKKTNNEYSEINVIPKIQPKKQNNIVETKSEMIVPQHKGTVIEEGSTLIKPRKKRQQNIEFANLDKKELEDTMSEMIRAKKEHKKLAKQEEKRLVKEQIKIEKQIEKVEKKLENLEQKEGVSEEVIQKTQEIRDNYSAAMREINKNIKKINSDYSGMSLADRRKQISNNANKASSERYQKLLYIREKEAQGESFNKVERPQEQSNFHKQAKNSNLSEYIKRRNPFIERMNEINDKGGITEEKEKTYVDRIANNWRERGELMQKKREKANLGIDTRWMERDPFDYDDDEN